jgi:nucleoside-diphosphate-sugar epimerase
MNIIVVGSSSPIGKSIVNRLSNRHKVTSVSRSSGDVIWDITSKSDLNLDGFEKFDVMINLVASQGGATYSKWGVYISSNDFCIAQEDGTRSFIDALIKCLIKLKNENEFNTIESTLL